MINVELLIAVLFCVLVAYYLGFSQGRAYQDLKKLLTKDKLPVYVRDTDIDILSEILANNTKRSVIVAPLSDDNPAMAFLKNQQDQFDKHLEKVLNERFDNADHGSN